MNGNRSITEVLVSWRRFIYVLTILVTIAAVVISLTMPKWYRASAVITPPREGEGSVGLLALMDEFRTGTGIGRAQSALKRSPQMDLMIGVLKSRHIRGQVVDRFSLVDRFGVRTREHAIRRLGMYLSVNTTPEGFVQVRVESQDRQLSADLANAFVDFLDRYNREASVEDARRTREFVHNRLEEVRGRLEVASDELRRFQEEHGAIQISEQTRVTVEAIASLEAERTRLEIKKGVLGRYARGSGPEIDEIEAQIAEIGKRIAQLRGARPSPAPEGGADAGAQDAADNDVMIPLGEFPSLGLQFADLKREVLSQEKVYEFLMAQFEEARIREARDLQTVTVLDAAVPPLRKSRPRRSLIVILTAGLGLVVSVGIAFAVELFEDTVRRRPDWAEAGEVRWLLHLVGFLRRLGGPARA